MTPGDRWRELHAQLALTNSARICVSAPVGIGLGHIIEQRIAESVEAGGVAVLVSNLNLILTQWVFRLRERRIPVVKLSGMSDLLLALDENPGAFTTQAGAVVLTSSFLVNMGTREQVSLISPDLLVVDRVPIAPNTPMSQAVKALGLRSRRMLVVRDDYTAMDDTITFDETITYNVHDLALDRHSSFTIELIKPTMDPTEDEIKSAVAQLLGRDVHEIETKSLTELHGELGRLATYLDAPEDASIAEDPTRETLSRSDTSQELLNVLLERLEDTSVDSRTIALEAALRRVTADGRPCLITVLRVSDAMYIESLARGLGLEASVIAGVFQDWYIHDAIERFGPGRVLIRGSKIQGPPRLPARTCHILWHKPTMAALWRYATQALMSEDVLFLTFDPETAEALARMR